MKPYRPNSQTCLECCNTDICRKEGVSNQLVCYEHNNLPLGLLWAQQLTTWVVMSTTTYHLLTTYSQLTHNLLTTYSQQLMSTTTYHLGMLWAQQLTTWAVLIPHLLSAKELHGWIKRKKNISIIPSNGAITSGTHYPCTYHGSLL